MMKGEDCFKQNKSTLKDVSYDDKNKVYMTESTIPVYDFDGIGTILSNHARRVLPMMLCG